jgi:hypothetical protein
LLGVLASSVEGDLRGTGDAFLVGCRALASAWPGGSTENNDKYEKDDEEFDVQLWWLSEVG